LAGRRLYLCTPDRPDLIDFVAACIRGGVEIVQLREKSLDDRTLLARAAALRDLCRAEGVPFILNDRPDLALAVGADGVHVGQDDCPPGVARRILGAESVVGLSTHSRTELDAAGSEPIDYVSVGPVLPTATHPDRAPTGFDYVGYARDHSHVPFYVTGDARPSTVPQLAAAGAERFVVVRWLTEATEPESAARELAGAIAAALAL